MCEEDPRMLPSMCVRVCVCFGEKEHAFAMLSLFSVTWMLKDVKDKAKRDDA